MRRRLLILATLAALTGLLFAPAAAAPSQVGATCSTRGHVCVQVLDGRFSADFRFPAEGCAPVRVRMDTEMVDEFRVCGTANEIVHVVRPHLTVPPLSQVCVFAGDPVRDRVCVDVVNVVSER